MTRDGKKEKVHFTKPEAFSLNGHRIVDLGLMAKSLKSCQHCNSGKNIGTQGVQELFFVT